MSKDQQEAKNLFPGIPIAIDRPCERGGTECGSTRMTEAILPEHLREISVTHPLRQCDGNLCALRMPHM